MKVFQEKLWLVLIFYDGLVTCILLITPICRDAGGDTGEGEKTEKAPKKTKEEEVLALTTRTGGAYIPPARLRAMQASITDKSRWGHYRLCREKVWQNCCSCLSNYHHISDCLFSKKIRLKKYNARIHVITNTSSICSILFWRIQCLQISFFKGDIFDFDTVRPIRELPGKPWRKVLMVWSTKSMCPISSLWSRNCFRKTLSGEGKLIVCITIQQWESIGDSTLMFWSYHVILWCVLLEGWWHAQSFRPRLPLPPSHTCMLPWCLWLTQRYVQNYHKI